MEKPKSIYYFVDAIIETCSAQLPRTCANCQKTFSTFKEFVAGTIPIGVPQAFMVGDYDPIGVLSYVNCKCGTTMVLKCEDMSKEAHHLFHETITKQCARDNKSEAEVLSELRTLVRETALLSRD